MPPRAAGTRRGRLPVRARTGPVDDLHPGNVGDDSSSCFWAGFRGEPAPTEMPDFPRPRGNRLGCPDWRPSGFEWVRNRGPDPSADALARHTTARHQADMDVSAAPARCDSGRGARPNEATIHRCDRRARRRQPRFDPDVTADQAADGVQRVLSSSSGLVAAAQGRRRGRVRTIPIFHLAQIARVEWLAELHAPTAWLFTARRATRRATVAVGARAGPTRSCSRLWTPDRGPTTPSSRSSATRDLLDPAGSASPSF